MHISVILAHPDPDSFNHAIAEICHQTLVKNNHSVSFHDLYKEGFDPLLPMEEFSIEAVISPSLQRYCNEVQTSDGLIIIHPNWWGMPPAILKGWIDRILRPGVAYRFLEGDHGEGVPKGLLRARSVIVFNTSNTSEKRENDVFGDPLENLWKTCIFDLCGIKIFYRKMFRIIVTSSQEQRQQWLKEVKDLVSNVYPGHDKSDF